MEVICKASGDTILIKANRFNAEIHELPGKKAPAKKAAPKKAAKKVEEVEAPEVDSK